MGKLIYKVLRKFAALLGFDIAISRSSDDVEMHRLNARVLEPFATQNADMERYLKGMKKTGMEFSQNFLKSCRFLSLQQVVRHCAKTHATLDFAECGCWKGHSTWVIASIMSDSHSTGKLHVFDSFEGGLSDKVEEDLDPDQVLSDDDIEKEKLTFASAESEVADNLSEFDFVRFYKGWIPERFSEVEERKFAFVHLDVDLYEPTRDGLEFFFPRLAEGGAIVIDDYNFAQFPGARKAVDQFLEQNPSVFFYAVPTGGAFLIKQAIKEK